MPLDAEGLAAMIAQAIELATAPLHARIGVLEQAKDVSAVLERYESLEREVVRLKALEPPAPVMGPAGRDGKDADFIAVKTLAESLVTAGLAGLPALVQGEVSKAVAAIPAPKDGRDGTNGKDIDPAIVDVMVQAQVERAVKALPVPRDGVDGRDGKDGAKGLDGAVGPMGPQGERGEAGAKGLDGAPGARGADGAPGPKGETGERGPQGERGEPGPAGVKGLDGEIGPRGPEGQVGRDGIQGEKGLDGLHGKDGLDGKPGRDGTLENLKVVHVDDRTFRFCLKDGTPIEGGEFQMDRPKFCGPFKDGETYHPGHWVVSKGSGYVALETTQRRPSDIADGKAWALIAMRGRDGTKGDPGQAGMEGRPGRDLTQLLSDGTKY